ncbi:MAG: TonB family protein [Myxococcales bacterium]|nr:TonB family protein [Myxococcales bacterium]
MRVRQSDWSRTVPFLVLSLLLHVLLVLYLRLPKSVRDPQPISLEFIERPRPSVLAKAPPPPKPIERGTVVSVPIEQPTQEPVDTRFLAEKSQKVDRDTWRPDILPQGMPSPGAPTKSREQPSAPAPPRPQSQTKQAAKAEAKEPAAAPTDQQPRLKSYAEGEWIASAKPTQEVVERRSRETSERRAEEPGPSLRDLLPTGAQLARVAPPGGRNEYLPELEPGDATRMNTREFKHYGYYIKLRDKISLAWDFPREGQGRDGRVAVKISINPDGTLKDVEMVKSSGFEPFDAEALEAVRTGAPFGPTPVEIRDGDGLLVLTLNFHYIGGSLFRVR